MPEGPRFIDLTGQEFGLWTVIGKHGNKQGGSATWECRCACGQQRVVVGTDLRAGKSRSCGCAGSRASVGKRARTHGASGSRLYVTWKNMRARCADPDNKRYGGKGVKVCDAWQDFSTFLRWALENGYSENLSIERLDSNGDYSPENCTWADAKAQARNRSIVIKAPDGRAWAEIAEEHGIPVGVMQNRIHSGGWPPEVAATWPLGKRRATRTRLKSGQYAPGPASWRR